MATEHTLDRTHIHHDWDRSREPALTIRPGDVVHFDLPITGEGQVEESSSIEDVAWDFETIYNLAGRSTSRAPRRVARSRSRSSSSSPASGAGRP